MIAITKFESYFSKFRKLIDSYWAFPLLLGLLVLVLSLCGISGSSVGTYDGLVNNASPHIGPLHTKPRAVRSDEWLVNTQMTIAQSKDGFPMINKHIGNGQDMSVVLDVPYKDWSILFKPQNLIFFITPLNFAFAFKWWLLAASLALSVYVLFLRIQPKQRLAAALLSVSVFFAPMVQWWYQSITLLPITFGLYALTLLLCIHEKISLRRRLLYTALLAYTITAFVLVMYPPFQIPVAIAIAFCYIAYVFFQLLRHPVERKNTFVALGLCALSAFIGLIFVGFYLVQHADVIRTISQTAYPGHRNIAAGNYSMLHVFGNFLSPFDQSMSSVAHYTELLGGANQSEISSFLFPIVPLTLLGCYLSFRKQAKKDVTAYSMVVGSTIALLLFLLRFACPVGSVFYKALALNLVPQNRLLIGTGVACITLLIGAGALLRQQPIALNRKTRFGSAIAIGILLCITDLFITHRIMQRSPGYVSHLIIALCAIVATSGFFVLFVLRKQRAAFAIFLCLSVASTVLANPLQHNLGEVTNTSFAQTIQAIVHKDPNGKWISNNAIVFENYALANGAYTLDGTAAYPQLDIWHGLDPMGQSKTIYNRYAHVEFSLDDATSTPAFSLPGPDTFIVKLSACNNFLTKENVKYVYSQKQLTSNCLQHYRTFVSKGATIYLYKRIAK